MPDVPNRDELEAELARVLGKLNRIHLARLLEYLGDPPDVGNVPDSFWREAGEELGVALRPFVEKVFLVAAERMLEDSPIGVDWGMINEAASNWSNRYSFDLVTGINQTSRQALQTAVSGFFRESMTLSELKERLGSIWGPVRASMISRTEVTRAAVEGERAFAREIEKEGITMVETWQTRNDERVCPLCGPLHGRPKGTDWNEVDGPPRHVNCRCWTIFELQKVRR